MKKSFFIALFLFSLFVGILYATDNPNQVPDEFANPILRSQVEEAKHLLSMSDLQRQYASEQQAFNKAASDLDVAKKAALTAAKKDDTWDIDMVASPMVFIEKPKAAPVQQPLQVPVPSSKVPASTPSN